MQLYITNGFTNILLLIVNCLWLAGITLIFDGIPQIIVQWYQNAVPSWPNYISSAADNTYHYNPSVRIIDLDSQATYVCCVLILYISGGTYSLKSIPNDRFFWRNFSWQFYLLSQFLPEICWEEIAEEILFVFCFDVWPGAGTLASRLISQHITY